MVSLESKISYLKRIDENLKLKAFHDLLWDKITAILFDNNLSSADELYLGIISSIQKNDKETFEKLYSKKSRSKPTKDSPSPFVNDDFLIFCLIVGITKFNIDKSWIKNIVSIRSRNIITITLENILNNNYSSTSNLPEIILIYFQLTNQSLITNDFLNNTYKSISENVTLFESKSDFQILCAFRAYDLIITIKEAPEGSEISLLKQFNKKFISRIRVLVWMLQIIILLGLLYALLNLPKYTPETVKLIDRYNYVFTILGAFGFTFLGNRIPFIRNKSQELIMRLLGYPKDLIKKSHKIQD